jgi:hypothetical protein
MRQLFARQDIPPAVRNLFVPNGRGTDESDMVLPLIPDFNKTQQISHECGIPVAMLNEDLLTSLKKYDRRNLQQDLTVATRTLIKFRELAQFLLDPNL